MENAIVITTINPPKEEVYQFASFPDWKLISVGDTKTPVTWHVENVEYLSPETQDKLFPRFSKIFPWKMYARKNLGYLYAIKNKAKLIYESDDDMLPYDNFPPKVTPETEAVVLSGKKFINVYNFFREKSDDLKTKPAWVRGFPPDLVKDQDSIRQNTKIVLTPFINAVQDDDSDFDAIYRFLYNDRLHLKKNGSFAIDKGSYAPVNTQSTFSFPPIYPLLYLPAAPGFHVEDIIRGYITQRILWELDSNMLFIHPVARTNNRNPHDIWKDFELEIPLFLKVKTLVNILDSISLYKDPLKSLLKIYTQLVNKEFFPKSEIQIVEAWAWEVEKLL